MEQIELVLLQETLIDDEVHNFETLVWVDKKKAKRLLNSGAAMRSEEYFEQMRGRLAAEYEEDVEEVDAKPKDFLESVVSRSRERAEELEALAKVAEQVNKAKPKRKKRKAAE